MPNLPVEQSGSGSRYVISTFLCSSYNIGSANLIAAVAMLVNTWRLPLADFERKLFFYKPEPLWLLLDLAETYFFSISTGLISTGFSTT